jgi:hypothetical protein
LCIIVLHDAIEKGIPLSLANTLARLTEVRDALKLKERHSHYSKRNNGHLSRFGDFEMDTIIGKNSLR